MITISFEQLKKKANKRPSGYIEDVLSFSTQDGDVLQLTDENWTKLREKYFHPLQTEFMPEIKHRFEICKTCDKSTEQGFGCSLHKQCCFGSWRTNPKSECYYNPPKWSSIPD